MTKIFFHPKAKQELNKLESITKERIEKKVRELKEHSKRGKPLKYSNYWILRIGDYRAIYEIKPDYILILFVGHRKQVYNDFTKIF